MVENNRKNKIIRVMNRLIDEGKRDFVIYPFGERVVLAKYILNTKLGVQEKFILDKNVMGWGQL